MLWRSMVRGDLPVRGAVVAFVLSLLGACECSIDSIRPMALPIAMVGRPYDFRLTHNCTGHYTTDDAEWELREGTLPPGINLSRDGRLSGTPREAGDYPFTVDLHYSWSTETGGGSRDASRQFTFTVLLSAGDNRRRPPWVALATSQSSDRRTPSRR